MAKKACRPRQAQTGRIGLLDSGATRALRQGSGREVAHANIEVERDFGEGTKVLLLQGKAL